MGEQMGLERPGEQLLGTSEVGVLCKGSKGRIILNNNYSYCLLSYLTIYQRLSKVLFVPLVFESSQHPPGRMGKLKPTEVK